VFRQAAESQIIQSAHRINAGKLPDLLKPESQTDFYFVPADTREVAVPRLIEIVKDRIPRRFGVDPVRDIQILCPMNRGGVGARSLNIELQKALNPRTEPRIEKFGTTYAVGDKVMQVENDYDKEVYNGDVGFVKAINLETGEIVIDFDSRSVSFQFGELDQLVLAYATTIHKSQESEYPVVVIPVMSQHYAMLQRTDSMSRWLAGSSRIKSHGGRSPASVHARPARRSSPPDSVPTFCRASRLRKAKRAQAA
jgi:exodeoxyribonuclease V alpha subunit